MAALKEIGERTLVRNILGRIRPFPGIGPGDDAAVVDIGCERLVICTDSVTFRRHRPAGMSAEAFGWMSVAVNYSDLASMGARPVGVLASLLMPENMDEGELYGIVDGMEECAEAFGSFIMGGDTKTGCGAVSVTAVGVMEGRVPMTRSGARPGDVVAVTGRLGSAAAGYHAAARGIEEREALLSLERPMPRIGYGIALAEAGATSCMDISDGLSAAAREICRRSGVGMDIQWDSLPSGTGVERMSAFVPKEHMMLDFGGDYELMFTMDREGLRGLRGKVDLTVIGTVNRTGEASLVADGERRGMTGGYEHFKDRG